MAAGAASHPSFLRVWRSRKIPENDLGHVDVVILPVVRGKKNLYMAPRGLDGVRVGPSKLINKANAVIDGAVRLTLRVEIPARCSAITDDRSVRFDPSITAFKVSAILSGTGNVLPDTRSYRNRQCYTLRFCEAISRPSEPGCQGPYRCRDT
jgi:hypothetical protein